MANIIEVIVHGKTPSTVINEFHPIPAGGQQGKVLTKRSNVNYDVDWELPTAGDMFKAIYDPNDDGQISYNDLSDLPTGSNATSLIKTADQALGGGRIVRATGASNVDYADKDTPADMTTVLGVTLGAVISGADTTVVTLGEMVDVTWNWTPDGTLYLGSNGLITQTVPTTGFLICVGVALSATTILIRLSSPIIL